MKALLLSKTPLHHFWNIAPSKKLSLSDAQAGVKVPLGAPLAASLCLH